MKYSLSCPSPCKYTISVDAQSDDEAIKKIMEQGKEPCKRSPPRYAAHDRGPDERDDTGEHAEGRIEKSVSGRAPSTEYAMVARAFTGFRTSST